MRHRLPILALSLALLAFGAGAQTIGGYPPVATNASPGLVRNTHPGYIANNWYISQTFETSAGTPLTPGANKIVCTFGILSYPVTLNSLGITVTTTDSTKRFQLGIYSTGSWGRPANLLVSTGDITLSASTGPINGAVSASLSDGPVWFCLNTESTVAVFTAVGFSANTIMSGFLGSASQATVGSINNSATGVTIAQTYGTWPASFNSGTGWTEVASSIAPWVTFKVASSP